VRYATPVAFRQALEARLLAHAKATSLPLDRLRKTVAFERILARLLVVAPNRWVLKGGFALDLRFGERARSTRDIDLGRADGPDEATADLLEAQAEDLDDHFVFAVERTDDLDEVLEGAAVRYRLTANLAGRRFEQVIVDIGFTDDLSVRPDVLVGPDLLTFAGLEPTLLPALPLAYQVAEKVHAYTRIYGVAGHHSSRVKDLVDIVIISGNAVIKAADLREALRATFDGRGMRPPPGALPLPPADWAVPFRQLATIVAIDPELGRGYTLAAAFLDPVLGSALPNDASWNPSERRWWVDDVPAPTK
jgi:hypothetical protein